MFSIQTSANGSSRVNQLLGEPRNSLGNFPSATYFRAVFSLMSALIADFSNVEPDAKRDTNLRTCTSVTIATLLLGESCNQNRSPPGREF